MTALCVLALTAVGFLPLDEMLVKFEEPTNHGGYFCFAFSPDGRKVAGGTGIVTVTLGSKTLREGGDVILWDARSGKILEQFSGHDEQVSWLAWSGDGKLLVSISNDNRVVKTWKPTGRSARKTFELTASYSSFNPPSLSGDGAHLAVIGEKKVKRGEIELTSPGDLVVWDTGKARVVFEEADSAIERLTFSRKGELLATHVQRRDESRRITESYLAVRSMPAGDVVWTCESFPESVECMAWSDGDQTLVVASPSTLRIVDPENGSVLSEIDIEAEHSPAVLALDEKGARAGIARFMGKGVELWDLGAGQRLGRRDFEFPDNIWHPAFDAELERLACKHGHDPGILDLSSLGKN